MTALDASGIVIKQDLSLRAAKLAHTLLNSAAIGGNVDASRAQFAGKLTFQRARVGGYVNLDRSQHGQPSGSNDGIAATRLHALRVGQVLSLRNARVYRSLNMRRLQTALALMLRGVTVTGQIVLHDAEIGGNLDLTRGMFRDVNLTGAAIGGELRLVFGQDVSSIPTWAMGSELNLRNAHARSVQDPTIAEAWPDKLNLVGFHYDLLGGYAANDQYDRPKELTSWLRRQERFTPQPYEQLVDVLDEMGLSETAEDIGYTQKEGERAAAWCKRRRSISSSSQTCSRDIGRWLHLSLQKYLVGFGYAHGVSLGWVLVLSFLGALVIHIDGSMEGRTFVAKLFYSFDRFLPVVRLDDFHYNDIKPARQSTRYYFGLHTLMGFVIAGYLASSLV